MNYKMKHKFFKWLIGTMSVLIVSPNAFAGITTISTMAEFTAAVAAERTMDGCDIVDSIKNNSIRSIPGNVRGVMTSNSNNIVKDGLTYCIIDSENIQLVDCDDSLTDVVIPASIEGFCVLSIADSAFENCSLLTNLTIADTTIVLSLGKNGDGQGLFYQCPLNTLYIGRNLKYGMSASDGYSPFYNKTALKNIDFGNNVTEVGDNLFRYCTSLKEINIPKSINNIGKNAFYNCSKLSDIKGGEGIITIGCKAFGACRTLSSMTLSETLECIEDSAFYYCYKLTEFLIPGSVKQIGNGAFEKCTGIKSLIIADGKELLSLGCNTTGQGLFYNCSLDTLYIGRDLFYSYSPFYNTYNKNYLSAVTFGKNLSFIPYNLFYEFKGLEEISFPPSINYIGSYAFYGCENLKQIVIPSQVSLIGESAFEGCSNLHDIDLGNVRYIECNVFSGCKSLTSLVIPSSVTDIYNGAFRGCIKLHKLSFKGSSSDSYPSLSLYEDLSYENGYTDYIGIFSDCPLDTLYIDRDLLYNNFVSPFPSRKFKIVTIGKHTPVLSENLFLGCSTCKFEIEDSKKSLGISCIDSWYDYTGTMPPTETSSSFYRDADTLYIGRDLKYRTQIYDYYTGVYSGEYSPFSDRKKGNITIGDSVTILGDYFFSRCTNLKELDLPQGINTIGKGAFRGCSSMNCINIPQNVKMIGEYAFAECSSLTEIHFPDSIKNIKKGAFYNLKQLKTVEFSGNALETLGDSVFAKCISLSKFIFPNLTKSIGAYAFYGCSSLTSLTLPKSLMGIEEYAFGDCFALDSIYVNWFSPFPIESNVFSSDTYDNAILFIPNGSLDTYQNTSHWNLFYKKEEVQSIYISSAGWATLFLDHAIVIPTGLNAYYGTYADEFLTLHEINGIIPSETAVILKGKEGYYPAIESLDNGIQIEENDLKGELEDIPTEFFDGDIYTLAEGSHGIGFYHFTGEFLSGGKAFLELMPGTKISAVRFRDSSNTSSIESSSKIVETSLNIYNLDGHKLKNLSNSGIYVINGKKVLIK